MKLQLMFLLMDVFILLAYAYLWLKSTVIRTMWRRLKLPN
jgi:hypothetical protein